MANTLVITKQPNDYFSFVLNGNVANEILNTRNDLLTIGNEAHFKTSQGANLIKNQRINYGDVTIVDGMTSVVPTSSKDLFDELRAVGYFDWILNGGGSGGVNRFDQLLDTFNYFGQDGKTVKVDESQLKLIPTDLPDTEYLNYFPATLVANKFLQVNPAGDGFVFVDPPNSDSIPPINYRMTIDYLNDPTVQALPVNAKAVMVTMNDVVYNGWSQTGINVTISGYSITPGYTDKATIYYQL